MKFKVGDKVRILKGHYTGGGSWSCRNGQEGTIIEKATITGFDWEVEFSDGLSVCFSEDELELVESKQTSTMHDSGKRQEFTTGAVRDTAEGKSRPDLISPYAQMRKGEWLRLGAEKYAERNWEKGIPIARCIASIERHIQEYKMGLLNEDHLAAIAVNAEFIMHFEAMIERGLLPAELDDMPKYEQRKKDEN